MPQSPQTRATRIVNRLLRRFEEDGIDAAVHYGVSFSRQNQRLCKLVVSSLSDPLKSTLDAAIRQDSILRNPQLNAQETPALKQSISERLLSRFAAGGIEAAVVYGVAVCSGNPSLAKELLASAPEPLKGRLDATLNGDKRKLAEKQNEVRLEMQRLNIERRQRDAELHREAAMAFTADFESARRIGQAAVFLAGLTAPDRALCQPTKQEVEAAVELRRSCVRSTQVEELLFCTDEELKNWANDGRLPVLFRRRMPSSFGVVVDVRYWHLALINEALGHLEKWRRDDAVGKRKVVQAQDLGPDFLLSAISCVSHAAKRRLEVSAQYEPSNHGFAGHANKIKNELYEAKDKGIRAGIALGLLRFECIHGNLAIWTGSEYRFQSTLSPTGVQADLEQEHHFSESRPPGAKGLRVTDAIATIAAISAPTATELGLLQLARPYVSKTT